MATSADYKLGEFSFPRGWFAMLPTAELTRSPVGVRALGQDFVLYRSEDGRPVMLDAYCPHMGAHLASGGMSVALSRAPQVEGDAIACPLHGWRFGSDGVCKEIPYSSAPIPPKARIRSYLVRDYAGFVIAWHDPEFGLPEFEPAMLPEFDDPAWVHGALRAHGELPVHQAEMIDHHVDRVHIVTVHGQEDARDWVTHFDGIHLSQRSNHGSLMGEPPVLMRSSYVSDYRGPGFMIMRIDGPMPMIVYSAGTPVEDGTTRFWNSVLIRADGAMDPAVLESVEAGMFHAFHEDHDILARKLPTINPMLVPGDGAFRRVRAWYKQFYMPRAASADIHARVDGDYATDGEIPAPWAARSAA